MEQDSLSISPCS